ncbi:MAG: glycosyltransferase family 1 protein [Verrucomicrobiia bacterium]
MKILYDGHVYRMQPVGGISRYLANIVNGLPDDWTPVVTVRNAKPSEYRQLRFPTHPNLVLKRFPVPYLRPKKLFNWAAKRYFARIESRKDFSLVHSVHHGSLALESQTKRDAPFVLTVHDMIPEIYSEELDPKSHDAKVKRKAVESADAVICVSENTRRDLLERIPVSEKRVFVTPLAPELSREMSLGDEPVPERPYFLFVGARKARYKNFAPLLQAFARAAEKWTELELCVVGPNFDPVESKLISELKIDGRVKNTGLIPDPHLAKLYRCSLALVYPSLYEGFGIPPLEAMACGSLAIVSDTSSLTEVTGRAAIMIDPRSIESMTEGMLKVCNLGSDQRQEWINRGLAWAARFQWSKTASDTIKIYKAVAA